MRFIISVIAVVCVIEAIDYVRHDDTDPADGRSGMSPFTDALTGCQYLSHGLGGLTPRRDGQGRQVGCKP